MKRRKGQGRALHRATRKRNNRQQWADLARFLAAVAGIRVPEHLLRVTRIIEEADRSHVMALSVRREWS